MRKVVQIISAAIVSVAFIGSVAGAEPVTCTSNVVINNSGNGNVTTVTCSNEQTATITCVNNYVVGNFNNQEGQSGSGSSTGGSVASGSVVNYNGTETTIGAACGGTTTPVSPSPTPSVKPSPSPTPAAVVKPAKLPYTAGVSAEAVIVASVATAAFIVAASRVTVAAYRRINIK